MEHSESWTRWWCRRTRTLWCSSTCSSCSPPAASSPSSSRPVCQIRIQKRTSRRWKCNKPPSTVRLALSTTVLLNPSDLTIKLLHLMVNISIPPNNLSSLNFYPPVVCAPAESRTQRGSWAPLSFCQASNGKPPERIKFLVEFKLTCKNGFKMFIKIVHQEECTIQITLIGVLNQICLSSELNEK